MFQKDIVLFQILNGKRLNYETAYRLYFSSLDRTKTSEREIVYGYFYNEIGDYTITRNDEPFAWVSKEKTAKLITGFANKDIQHLQLISGNVSGKELADSLMENAKLEAEVKALRGMFTQISAWLSFNTNPSAEELAKMKNSIDQLLKNEG